MDIYVVFEKTHYRTRILRVYHLRENAVKFLVEHADTYVQGSQETEVSSTHIDYDNGNFGIRVNEFTAEAGDCWTIFGFEKCKVHDYSQNHQESLFPQT